MLQMKVTGKKVDELDRTGWEVISLTLTALTASPRLLLLSLADGIPVVSSEMVRFEGTP